VLAVFVFGVAAEAEDAWQATEGWHTLHHDVMRTGRTLDSPGVPFRYLWHQEYWSELVAPEVEPIVAEGLVFVGTLKGVVHALEADSGKEMWRADLGSPIHHSPAYSAGKLVTATMSPRDEIVAFEAATGKELWRFKARRRGSFAASPAVYRGIVYIGDRAGDFYAVDLATGALKWRTSLGAPVLQTAAVRDGRVAVAAEDLVPRLLSAADGKELWKGPPMAGATVRGYYPVFWNDLIVWRTETYGIDAYHSNIQEATEDGKLYAQTRRKHGWSKQAENIIRTIPGRYSDEKYEQEQRFIQEQMQDGKHPRSFYAFKVADGTEPIVYAVGCHSSENGYSVPASPPVDQDGRLYVFTKSIYSEWPYPIRAFDAVSTLDQGSALPRLIRGIDRSKGSFPATCDESNNLTIAGDKLYDTHDHVLAYMDQKTRKIYNAYSAHAPELWGGVFKASAPDNVSAENPGVWKLRDVDNSLHLTVQWNGPSQGAVAIYKDKVWWITGSMVVCLKGTVEP
jgi:outer membrane protein assembly factor BamB